MRDRNMQVIDGAFSRFAADKKEVIASGMYRLLESAVKIALEAHDERHQAHVETGDTYGWMLVHDGKIEEIAVVATEKDEGKASQMLRSKADELPDTGWCGVVMAGLTPADYFAVDYEYGMLDYAMQMTRDDFHRHFRRI